MAKEPIELGNDKTKLGFQADIDLIIDKFIDKLFNVDGKNPCGGVLSNIENITSQQLLDSVGLSKTAINKLENARNWFNEVGVPELLKNNIITNEQVQTIQLPEITVQLQEEAIKATKKLKSKKIKEKLKELDDNDIKRKHSGGIRDILRLFIKLIYKLLGFFVQIFFALLSPLQELVQQLFFNIKGPTFKNPFPIIPDIPAINIQIALTSAIPGASLIHIKNLISTIITQINVILNINNNVLLPIINFFSDPNSFIVDLTKIPFDGVSLPIPEIDLGILGINLPSFDKKGLFTDPTSELSFEKNLKKLKKIKGKNFNDKKLKSAFKKGGNLKDAFSDIGLPNLDFDLNLKFDPCLENILEKSPILQEINFMNKLQEYPLMQMKYIESLEKYNKLDLFYREPYIENDGYQYDFDFFKDFPLHTYTQSGITFKGLWDSIVDSELNNNSDFISKFYDYLKSYNSKTLPDVANYLTSKNGDIINGTKTASKIDIGDNRIIDMIEPIDWDVDNDRNLQILTKSYRVEGGVNRAIRTAQDIKAKNNKINTTDKYDSINKLKNKASEEIQNENTKIGNINDESYVKQEILEPWDGDEIYAYRNWFNLDKKMQYYFTYIDNEKRKFLFNNAFNDKDREEVVKFYALEVQTPEKGRQILVNPKIQDNVISYGNEKFTIDRIELLKGNIEQLYVNNLPVLNLNSQYIYLYYDYNDIDLINLSTFRNLPIDRNYILWYKDDRMVTSFNYTYGFTINNNSNLKSEKYQEINIVDTKKFLDFWQNVKPNEYNYYNINFSEFFDIYDLNLTDKHGINAQYEDLIPVHYDESFYYKWQIQNYTGLTNWTSGNSDSFWDFSILYGSLNYVNNGDWVEFNSIPSTNLDYTLSWTNETDVDVSIKLEGIVKYQYKGYVQITVDDEFMYRTSGATLTEQLYDTLNDISIFVPSGSIMKIKIHNSADFYSNASLRIDDIKISSTYIVGDESKKLERGDSFIISKKLLNKLYLYESYYSQQRYFQLQNNFYFYLDGKPFEKVLDKVITGYDNNTYVGEKRNINPNYTNRKKFFKKFLYDSDKLKIELIFDKKNIINELFDFKLNSKVLNDLKKLDGQIETKNQQLSTIENDTYKSVGVIVKNKEYKTIETDIQKLKEKRLKLYDTVEKDFYYVLKRSYQLNFWNYLYVESNGKVGKLKYGNREFNSDGFKRNTNFDFKRFKLGFWKLLPSESLEYFNSYNDKYILYFKEYTEYKDQLTTTYSEVLRISNEKTVSGIVQPGILDDDTFRSILNDSVSNITDLKLPVGSDRLKTLFCNYDINGLPIFNLPDFSKLNLSLKSNTSTPAFLTWFTAVIQFIQKLIMIPINILMTLIEILLNIIKNAVTLNLPGVIKQIVKLLKFLTPNLDFFKNLILPIIGVDMFKTLMEQTLKFNELGLNPNMKNFEKFMFDLDLKRKSKCEKSFNKKREKWLQDTGLDENIFIEQIEVKNWLKSVGLNENFINLDKFKTRNADSIIDDIKICLGGSNFLDSLFDIDLPNIDLGKIPNLSQKFDKIFDDLCSGIPDLLKDFFLMIRILITDAFPNLLLDTIGELFKWIIQKILEIFPFLGNKTTAKSLNIETGEIINKIENIFENDTKVEKEKNLKIKQWLLDVGLNENFI